MAFNSLADFKIPDFGDDSVVGGNETESSRVVLLSLDEIEIWKDQPRNYIDPQEISELAKSIQQYEQIAPIVVRRHPTKKNKYLIVAGEKRYRASIEAGCSEIEAKIRDLDETEAYEIALVENRKRSGLNPIDDTIGTLTLIEKKTQISREKIINYLHKIGNKQDEEVPIDFWETVSTIFEHTCNISVNTFVKKRLRLLNLPDFILKPIQKKQISGENAPTLSKLADKNEELAREIVQKVISEKWTKRKIEEEVKKILSAQSSSVENPVLLSLEETKNNFQRVYKKIARSQTILSNRRKQRKLNKLIQEMEKLLEN